MRLPNIYHYKHINMLILVPLLLMVIGIYFSTHIVLDSSLRGGVSILLETSSNMTAPELAGKLASNMHVAGVDVAKSPGGFQITLPVNQSLATADSYLLNFYSDASNYSALQLNYTSLSIALNSNPSNSTIRAELSNVSNKLSTLMAQMQGLVRSETQALASFGISPASNSSLSSLSSMQNIAQSAYSTASSIYENKTMAEVKNIVPYTSFSFEEVTPTLGKYFLSQFTNILIIAFVLIFLSVFFIFRTFIPSLTVTFGALNDMIIALGIMGLFKIPLGVASIAGLLMIIGYAIDTDILAAIRIIKRGEGTVEERAYSSMRTGLTMTSTAIMSFLVLFLVSVIVYVPTYYEISSVVVIGLIGDIFTTWLGNTPILMYYKRRKERR